MLLLEVVRLPQARVVIGIPRTRGHGTSATDCFAAVAHFVPQLSSIVPLPLHGNEQDQPVDQEDRDHRHSQDRE